MGKKDSRKAEGEFTLLFNGEMLFCITSHLDTSGNEANVWKELCPHILYDVIEYQNITDILRKETKYFQMLRSEMLMKNVTVLRV